MIHTARYASLVVSFMIAFTGSSPSWATQQVPDCKDEDEVLEVDNPRVIELKKTTQNQYLARAHVSGKVTRITRDRSSHLQFEIQIGPGPKDTLEVIYNKEFGDTGTVAPGAVVRACGDYITSFAQAGRYPPSPSGAIIHWVHQSNTPDRHDHGYLVIDGRLVGFNPSRTDRSTR